MARPGLPPLAPVFRGREALGASRTAGAPAGRGVSDRGDGAELPDFKGFLCLWILGGGQLVTCETVPRIELDGCMIGKERSRCLQLCHRSRPIWVCRGAGEALSQVRGLPDVVWDRGGGEIGSIPVRCRSGGRHLEGRGESRE